MLQPLRVRTWALRGVTPRLKCWHRHDRLSVISAVTVSPRRRRHGLYFEVLRHNVKTPDVLRFVRGLRRKLGRGLIIVWDGLSQHRAVAKKLASRGYVFVELPGYAPDLNPDEWVWRHAKYVDLRNSCPAHIDDLQRRVTKSLRRMHRRPALLRAFFRGARLSL